MVAVAVAAAIVLYDGSHGRSSTSHTQAKHVTRGSGPGLSQAQAGGQTWRSILRELGSDGLNFNSSELRSPSKPSTSVTTASVAAPLALGPAPLPQARGSSWSSRSSLRSRPLILFTVSRSIFARSWSHVTGHVRVSDHWQNVRTGLSG